MLAVLALVAVGALVVALLSIVWGAFEGRTGRHAAGGRSRPGAVRVEVLNGEGRPGDAEDLAADLREAGFQVVRVANADRSDYRGLTVLARTPAPDAMAKAHAVAAALSVRTVLLERQEEPAADVTVLVGR